MFSMNEMEFVPLWNLGLLCAKEWCLAYERNSISAEVHYVRLHLNWNHGIGKSITMDRFQEEKIPVSVDC